MWMFLDWYRCWSGNGCRVFLGQILGFTGWVHRPTFLSLKKFASGEWLVKSSSCEDSKDKALHGFGTRFWTIKQSITGIVAQEKLPATMATMGFKIQIRRVSGHHVPSEMEDCQWGVPKMEVPISNCKWWKWWKIPISNGFPKFVGLQWKILWTNGWFGGTPMT